MDITMDQLYGEMRKLSEGQAVQAQMLTQVLQRLDQHTQISAQQGAQLAALFTEVSVLKSEVTTRNLEIVSLQAWRAELPSLYIPRKEHEAQKHEGRISELEDRMAENQKSSLTNVIQWGLSILAIIVTVAVFALSYFKH